MDDIGVKVVSLLLKYSKLYPWGWIYSVYTLNVCVCVCVCVCACARMLSCSFISYSLQPHGLQPSRLLSPWNSPGKNTGVGCHSLLQGIFSSQVLNAVSCILCIGRWVLYHWATWEDTTLLVHPQKCRCQRTKMDKMGYALKNIF